MKENTGYEIELETQGDEETKKWEGRVKEEKADAADSQREAAGVLKVLGTVHGFRSSGFSGAMGGMKAQWGGFKTIYDKRNWEKNKQFFCRILP